MALNRIRTFINTSNESIKTTLVEKTLLIRTDNYLILYNI
jgi:hypothetical protein